MRVEHITALILLLVAGAVTQTEEELVEGCAYDAEDVTFSAASGTIREPQNNSIYQTIYSSSLYCQWYIKDLSNPDVLYFNLRMLSLPEDHQCGQRLLVHDETDGLNLNQLFFERCSSIEEPMFVRTTTNYATILFHTDASGPENVDLTLSWFYAPVCSQGPTVLSETDYAVSVSWPWYEGTPDCQYLATADKEYIRILINEFKTTNSAADCSGDYLEIANALDPTEIWHKFCEPILDFKAYRCPGNSAIITHHRTTSNDGNSFEFSFESSNVKGFTLAQRESIKWGCVGAGIVVVVGIIIVVALCFVKSSPCYYKKKFKKFQTPVEPVSSTNGMSQLTTSGPSNQRVRYSDAPPSYEYAIQNPAG